MDQAVVFSTLPKHLDSPPQDQTTTEKSIRIAERSTLPPLDTSISEPQRMEPARREPPARDQGWAAWVVLFAATTVSAFPCGIYLSYGVYQAYYKITYPNATNSAWIGALSSGLPFLLAPLMVYICTHTNWSRIHFVWISWLVGIIALIGAAFSLNIKSLIITQGLLFGLSIVIGDNPLLLIINTWFQKHRGLAYGILFGACDLFGVGWSFLANYLLHHVGQRKTFLIFAAILFAIPGPCLLLLKERGSTNILHRSTLSAAPKSAQPKPRRGSGASGRETADDTLVSPIGGSFELSRRDTPPTTKRFFRRPLFYVFATSNLVQSLAFYLPLIYLPTYALQLHGPLPPTLTTTTTATTSSPNHTTNPTGALALALINLAQILGEVSFGRLSDCLNVHLLAIISTSLASLSTFLLWGFATSKPMLLAYGFVFGFSGAAFLALWARMGMLFGERDAMMVYAVLSAGRGLGGVVSGPVSIALLGGERGDAVGSGWAGEVAGGRYRNLIVFVGVCMAVGAVLGVVGFVIDQPEKREVGGETTESLKRSETFARRLSSTSWRKGSAVSVQTEDIERTEKGGTDGCLVTEDWVHGSQYREHHDSVQTVLNGILHDLRRPQRAAEHSR